MELGDEEINNLVKRLNGTRYSNRLSFHSFLYLGFEVYFTNNRSCDVCEEQSTIALEWVDHLGNIAKFKNICRKLSCLQVVFKYMKRQTELSQTLTIDHMMKAIDESKQIIDEIIYYDETK
jgi:hypothetical protein